MDYEQKTTAYEKQLSPNSRRFLADQWGVSQGSTRRIRTGFDKYAYMFPVSDADGQIIGIRTRAKKDIQGKYFVKDSTPGLFIPRGVTPANAEIISESESDLAASLTLDVAGIARPGARMCFDMVVQFFGKRVNPCPCIVADNDAEGIGGADDLADSLTDVGIPCRILIPPEPHGDLREWFVQGELTRDVFLKQIHAQPIRWPDSWPPGYVQIPNAPFRNGVVSRIGAGPFALACLLKSFYGTDGRIFPDRAELARLMGCAISTVDRRKRKLEQEGIIVWKRGGSERTNEYRVDFGPLRERIKKVSIPNRGGNTPAGE